MSLQLHHWKIAGGHENKYEWFWSVVIPLPNKGSFGHKDIENKVEAGDGLKWENEFKKSLL